MRIIIDADACPKMAKKICVEKSKLNEIEVIMVVDHSHELYGEFSVIQVDQGKDSVDLEIVRICQQHDIIITQDYGLATLVLAKVKAVINPNGFEYTQLNIESLMFQRFMGEKLRKSGKRTKGPKKRSEREHIKFEKILEECIRRNYEK
jgi:uncharacterized protein YaiI (UPF0178 family)